ncbi:MAG TPA: DegT/DnrJ/EryC1/StrS family aminotransferase [bacterium]|nr:DegT/DnrJ/EryC1/StrS family aminotransferase [bacterium]
MKPFESPVYITRPVLPDIDLVTGKIKEIWDAKWLTNNGAQHGLLEERLRVFLKAPNIALFNNGTIALLIACNSLRLSGEVITTPFTFPATPHVLTWNNIKPIFCDIDPETMNIDPAKIESLITPQTTAILAVHVFGTPCDVDAIKETADRYGLKVVYDAAHVFGVEKDGRGIGTFGDISMFSFHATKTFHTAEGGALTFNDPDLKQRIEYLKNFGIKNEEEVVMPGINGKMNEVQAAIGLLVLDLVESEIARRGELSALYLECLSGVPGLKFLPRPEGVRGNSQYFIVRVDEKEFGISRDEMHAKLRGYNVYSRKYFYPLCSDYPCYRQLPSSAAANLPVAARTAREVISLPLYGGLSNDTVIRICDMIKSMR